MKEKQRLIITLPTEFANLPIQIIRSSNHRELVFSTQSMEENRSYSQSTERKYVFLWRQNDYLKVMLDEIIWIEANGSYSKIYITEKRTILLSFNLATIEKELPSLDFMRIHRSHIVNLKHVISLTGNSLNINGMLLTIGRQYRESILDRFIFLGVRRKNK